MASYLSRFHIHPCIKIELIEEKNGKFIFPNNDVVFWEAKTDEVLLKDVLFAPQFNILQNTKTLILKNNKSIDTMLKNILEKMKIIFFTDHFYPEISAPAAHIFDRCRIWVKKGHDVTVITNFPNYPDGKVYSRIFK